MHNKKWKQTPQTSSVAKRSWQGIGSGRGDGLLDDVKKKKAPRADETGI